MSSAAESTLLCKLESSDIGDIYSLFSDYLRAFSDLTNAKKYKSTSKQKQDEALRIRPLAKQFLPFLNKCLSILPKRLSNRQQFKETPLELFHTYKLCLDCLEMVASQLSCKPCTVQIQRLRLIHILEAWGQYEDVESEGFRVLEKLRSTDSGSKKRNLKGNLLPNVEKGDSEFGMVVVEVVVAIVKCVAMGQGRDSRPYWTVVGLVEEVGPWFRVLDEHAYEKLHRVYLTYLGKCALYLAGKLIYFDGDLSCAFCKTTLIEYANSSMKDQIYKFAHRICSTLFSVEEGRTSCTIDTLTCILSTLACECKDKMENSGLEFVELVSYCANKGRIAGTPFCGTIAGHINGIAGDFYQIMGPHNLILRLYATGLDFTNCDVKSRDSDVASSKGTKDVSAIRILLDGDDKWHNLAALLSSLGSYFHISCTEHCASCIVGYKNSISQICRSVDSSHGLPLSCPEKMKAYLPSYLNALKFLCQPLADLINSEKKQMLGETEAAPVSTHFSVMQNAFHQYCDTFLFLQRSMSEGERDGFDDSKTVLSVTVAAFILSIRTQLKIKKSEHLVKHMIACDWIQPQGLKYLFVSLYNIGVVLYRNKELKEASKALKLCCRASWTCVVLFCQTFVHKSGVCCDLSEEAIVDFFSEACNKSAFLLDVLHQCGSPKIKNIIVDSLEDWSVAAELFSRLPAPVPMVKQWVKIECKLHKNLDPGDGYATLYSLLSSSIKVSKRTIGIILEQELLAYEEMYPLHPEFCQSMQIEIINILLRDVYVTEDSYPEKSRILLRKGRALRALGIESLKECIQCLSEAITIMNEVYRVKNCLGTQPCHLLPVAYALRALSIQEAEPNSKQIFQDIDAALNLWLRISIPDHCYADSECNMLPENTMLLLYAIVDLLSMKGCLELHHDIYKLIFRIFKWKNIQVENGLTMLWECRRLSHALCVSPINDAFILNLSEHCGELSKSMDFWICSLKASHPLLIGFQQNFSLLPSNFPCSSHNYERSFRSEITNDDVKMAASELVSIVPLPSRSAFVAGYLYYDLCEKLILEGRLSEALSFAKDAHRLRTQLFQEKFKYSIEQQVEKYNDAGNATEKHTYGLKTFEVCKSVVGEMWSFDTAPRDMHGCYLSPWNVLQCYLESTLQVGIVNELIGNGMEAETFLLWGKSISSSQNLLLFTVAFSSVLGKLYHKKGLLDLAEKELESAKQILIDSCGDFSCLKCRLMLEVSVDQQLGDLSQNHFDSAARSFSIERLSYAESLYKLALDKLNLSDWKNSVSCSKEASTDGIMDRRTCRKNVGFGAKNPSAGAVANQSDAREYSAKGGPKAKIDAKKCRKTKKEQHVISELSSRLTRSMCQSSKSQSLSSYGDGVSKQLSQSTISGCSNISTQSELLVEEKRTIFDACICTKMEWHCLCKEVMESNFLDNYIYLKWEFGRRQLSLRVLTSLGECLGNRGQIHQAHEVTFQSIAVLFSRNSFQHSYPSVPVLLDLIGKELTGDVFAIDRANVLYNLCWFFLKGYHSKDTRTVCCDLSHIQLPKVISWLLLAFVLCREVPIPFQKVSRLLAVIYLLSASKKDFCLTSTCNALSESHWASYFHQASLGTHISYQFFSNMSQRNKAQPLMDAEVSVATGSTCIGTGTLELPRLAPDSTKDLEKFVMDFFKGLPCTTVIGISLLGRTFASLLQEVLLYPSCVSSWMLLSRLNSKSQPVVILLPVDSVLEEISNDDADSSSGELTENNNGLDKQWHCPWDSSVIDDVAPTFKLILKENYISSSNFPLEDTKKNRSFWWARRKKLDQRLGKLLSNLEDSWLGPWRYVLLGEWSNCKHLDSVHKKLVHDLKSKCKVDVNETLLKVILGGGMEGFKGEACISQLCLKNGCYIGTVGYCSEDSYRTPTKTCNGVVNQSGLALQLIHGAVNELEEDDNGNREPIILVLDCEIQMLPWENIPILRNQEVYRMPSVGSISATLNRSCHHQEQFGQIIASFPLIDPLDAFYLLNPSGDLSSTQVEFESWFRDQNLEGKAGSPPTAQELAIALKSHDLFIYFGHGSGAQYISRHEIQKLDKCAATLLMGCSSGSLLLNGCYIPQGMPLSYLLGGSPVIVANLWEVTDKDIDRFAKAMLDAWLKERSSSSVVGCAQCDLVAKEFEDMNIKGNSKRVSRKKLPVTSKNISKHTDSKPCKNDCDHRPTIGSFMAQAREACTLPFLIGASPVCYGVPTGIRRKRDL